VNEDIDESTWNRRAYVAIGYVWLLIGPIATLVWFGGASSGYGSVFIWIPVAILGVVGAAVQCLLVVFTSRRATSAPFVVIAALVPLVVTGAALVLIGGTEVFSAYLQLAGFLAALSIGLAIASVVAANFYGDRRAL
jgi:hypothetical protein